MDIAFIFWIGAAVGSFAGLSADRIPRGESVFFPRSHCRHCRAFLSMRELIPLVSWLSQSGKCRHCQNRIPVRDLVAEIICGILYILAYQKFGMGMPLVSSFVLIYFLVMVAYIDEAFLLILNKVMLAMFIAGVMLHLLMMMAMEQGDIYPYGLTWPWLDGALGFLIGGGVMLVVFLISGGMGLGDVWFTAVIGFWLGADKVLLTVLLSFGMGGMIGALLLLLRVKGRKDYIAFGPFLAVAAFISALYGSDILYFWRFMLW